MRTISVVMGCKSPDLLKGGPTFTSNSRSQDWLMKNAPTLKQDLENRSSGMPAVNADSLVRVQVLQGQGRMTESQAAVHSS